MSPIAQGTIRARRTRIVPRERGVPGWYAILPPAASPRRLASREEADCAIIGAGFTGLMAAHRLAELRPHWRIVILEAQRVGLGTSGRSSGFVVDFANNPAWTSSDIQRRAVRLNRAGREHLCSTVKKFGLENHWSQRSWLHTVASAEAMPLLGNLMNLLDEREEPYETFDRERLRHVVGTDYYYAGLRIPNGAMVQPAGLTRGLADHLPKAVDLFEESPVRSIVERSRLTIETAGGTVDASKLIIAINGFSPSLGFLRQRVFPLMTFASMTRTLTADEREVLSGDKEWGLIAQEPHGASLRRTRDHRILVRHLEHYSKDLVVTSSIWESAVESHRRILHERFPSIPDVPFEFTWTGVLGMTRGRLPYFGEVAPHVYTSAGYSGSGIAMGTAAGMLLAELTIGAHSSLLDDMRKLPKSGWLPPQPLLGRIVSFQLERSLRRAAVTQ